MPRTPEALSASKELWPIAPLFDEGVEDPLLPLLPPVEVPPPEPPDAGVVGVNVAAVFARQALTASFKAFVSLGAFVLIVAFPAKLQDCAFLFVAS